MTGEITLAAEAREADTNRGRKGLAQHSVLRLLNVSLIRLNNSSGLLLQALSSHASPTAVRKGVVVVVGVSVSGRRNSKGSWSPLRICTTHLTRMSMGVRPAVRRSTSSSWSGGSAFSGSFLRPLRLEALLLARGRRRGLSSKLSNATQGVAGDTHLAPCNEKTDLLVDAKARFFCDTCRLRARSLALGFCMRKNARFERENII